MNANPRDGRLAVPRPDVPGRRHPRRRALRLAEMNGAVTDAADQFHLTGQGQSRLIAMVLELGFAPLG